MKRTNIYDNNHNNLDMNKYRKWHNSDSEVNSNLNSQQSNFAKNDVGGRLDRDRKNHSNYTNAQNDDRSYNNPNHAYQSNGNQPVYIDWNERQNYPSKDFYGDVTKPWSVENTAGWNANDMSNPHNPNVNGQHKKSGIGKKILYGIITVVVLLFVWFAGTDYEASHQSAKPQKPQVVRKTVINKQPQQKNNPSNASNNQNGNSGNSKVLTPQDKDQIYKLSGEMQKLKLNNQEQQDLLNAYSKLDNNIKPTAYRWASLAGNMSFIPTGVKRFAVVHVLNHYNKNNNQNAQNN